MLLTPQNVPGHLKDFVEPQNRPALDRATRDELIDYAETKGLDLDPNMPRDLIIQILRNKGFTDIKAAVRVMGVPVGYRGDEGVATGPSSISSVDAMADLQRQWERRQQAGQNKSAPKGEQMSMNELRSEAKRRGIKLSRTDTRDTIKEKLAHNG